MNEDFLAFVWRHQYFEKFNLKTTTGQQITIESTGFLNTNAGPDFQEAIIIIDEVKWAGHVELHVRSSDWLKHHHQFDKAYENVILHVVWEHDKELEITAPTLELKNIVSHQLLDKYLSLKQNLELIPCASQLHKVNPLVKLNMLEKALVERLERKSLEVLELYHTNQDWLETAYQLLMKYMGFKVNNDPFLELAKLVPLKSLQKHREDLFQLEAMLFGQAGLIMVVDAYSEKLKKEYEFLALKYQLTKPMDSSRWKFLRLRPPNFPTIRLAQVAALLSQEVNLFSLLTEQNDQDKFFKSMSVTVSDYWKHHYHFGKKKSKDASGKIGVLSLNGIAINVVAPLKFAYAIHQDKPRLKETVIEFLESLKLESNAKTKKMSSVGFVLKSANDSQAAIELFDNYCCKKQCLHCAIGVSIIKSLA